MSDAALFPVTKQIAFKHGDILVNIVSMSYEDYNYVIVTHMKKLGTMITVKTFEKADGSKAFEIATLLGKRDDDLLHVYARRIAEVISQDSVKPLLLAISISPEEGRSTELFSMTINRLCEVRSW